MLVSRQLVNLKLADVCFTQRHPVAKSRPIAGSVLWTLQNSDSTLLTSSTQVSEDKITKDNQSVMLGAPLTAGNQLYLDLQQRYIAS